MYTVAWIVASFGLVPLAWLTWLRATGRARDVAWWWLATAFALSFVADVSAFLIEDPSRRWVVSATYPLSQAGLIGFVFLLRRDAMRLVGVLAVVALAAVFWQGVTGPDVFFRTVAWGAVAGIVVDRWALGRLRTSLLVYFGLGLLAWWGYVFSPGWWTWGAYQTSRAIGIALFCLAATRPAPALTLR